MFEPKNEMGVIAVFCMALQQAKWEIVSVGTAFPDAVLRHNGEVWRAEFEYQSKNFDVHGHDARECDIIICWIDNLPDSPIPVIQLSDSVWLNQDYRKADPIQVEITYWQRRALRAERMLYGTQDTSRSTDVQLSDRQRTLLAMIESCLDDNVNVADFARRLNVTRPTVYADLKILQSVGKLTLNGHVEVSR